MNDIEELQRKLIELFERYMKAGEDGYCKSGEPSINISINNELKWSAEIYSYVFNFHDGGRHHYFKADTYESLIKQLRTAINLVELNEIKPLEDERKS